MNSIVDDVVVVVVVKTVLYVHCNSSMGNKTPDVMGTVVNERASVVDRVWGTRWNRAGAAGSVEELAGRKGDGIGHEDRRALDCPSSMYAVDSSLIKVRVKSFYE